LIIAWTNSFILIQQLKRKLEILNEQIKIDTDKNKNKQQRFRLEGVRNAGSGWVVTGRDREKNSKIGWILVLELASCDRSLPSLQKSNLADAPAQLYSHLLAGATPGENQLAVQRVEQWQRNEWSNGGAVKLYWHHGSLAPAPARWWSRRTLAGRPKSMTRGGCRVRWGKRQGETMGKKSTRIWIGKIARSRSEKDI
jgi:hypothetical protein